MRGRMEVHTVDMRRSKRNHFRCYSRYQYGYHHLGCVSIRQRPMPTGSHSPSSTLTSGFPRRAVLESNFITANAKELVVVSQDTVPNEWHLRNTKAHQGHRTKLLPCRHLQAPDDDARIDGERNVHECGNTCVGHFSLRTSGRS